MLNFVPSEKVSLSFTSVVLLSGLEAEESCI